MVLAELRDKLAAERIYLESILIERDVLVSNDPNPDLAEFFEGNDRRDHIMLSGYCCSESKILMSSKRKEQLESVRNRLHCKCPDLKEV